MPSKGMVHPYPARALMADLYFMGTRESSSSPIRSRVCRSLRRITKPEPSPKGETKSNGEVECAVQSVQGLARTLKDFLEQQSIKDVEMVDSLDEQKSSRSVSAKNFVKF